MTTIQYPVRKEKSSLSVLTPYLIPESMASRKVVNLGDGFILRAIERLLGQFSSQKIFSPRIKPSREVINALNMSPATILAGANQLNDRYTVWPSLTGEVIRSSHLRFIPFGIGLHGEDGFTDGLSDDSKDVFRAIHEKIEFSSWRCPHTVAFLHKEFPELSSQILMTGCPVIYDKPLLEDEPFTKSTRRIAVTVTERQDFWERETAIIDFVAKTFRRSNRYLVLHQNYFPPSRFEHIGHRWLPQQFARLNPYQKLRRYAVKRGFKIFCPADAEKCIKFYKTIDFHIGSRLHAHLLFISQSKRSLLVPVDGRAEGMAAFLNFPLCSPDELELAIDFDFEIVRESAKVGFSTMNQFLQSIPK